MNVPPGVVHLARQGYRAWLHDGGRSPGPESARRFAETMTDHGRHTYESLRQAELEEVLRDAT